MAETFRRLLANRRCQRVRWLLGEASSTSRRSLCLDRRDLGLEPVAVVVLVLVGARGSGHAPAEFQPVLAERFLLGEAF